MVLAHLKMKEQRIPKKVFNMKTSRWEQHVMKDVMQMEEHRR
jgi:hypothetical protein